MAIWRHLGPCKRTGHATRSCARAVSHVRAWPHAWLGAPADVAHMRTSPCSGAYGDARGYALRWGMVLPYAAESSRFQRQGPRAAAMRCAASVPSHAQSRSVYPRNHASSAAAHLRPTQAAVLTMSATPCLFAHSRATAAPSTRRSVPVHCGPCARAQSRHGQRDACRPARRPSCARCGRHKHPSLFSRRHRPCLWRLWPRTSQLSCHLLRAVGAI